MRAIWKSVARHVKDDSGVAGLVIAGLIAIVAFSALSVFLNKYIGDRTFERAKASAAGQSVIMPAILAYYLGQNSTSRALPCPDSKSVPTGEADTTCSSTQAVKGVLPWVTMGLSKDQVLDAYGNYYTYVLSGTAKAVCSKVTGDVPGTTSTTTYTGGLVDPSDLTYTAANGTQRNVPFVVISHGKNGYGAKRSTGADIASPTSSNELTNVNVTNPDSVIGGPTASDFDDIVLVPTLNDLRKSCEQLTPGGKLNAEVADNFDGAGALSTSTFDTSGSASPPTKTRNASGNGVLSFTNNTSYLATASAYNFRPTVRPVYVSALWTPDPSTPAATSAGFNIATRATLGDLGASGIFTGAGLTFRFYQSDAGGGSNVGDPNRIMVCDQTTPTCDSTQNLAMSAGTYALSSGSTYLIEVYDSGSTVWMRITDRDDVTNTASLTYSTSVDLTGEQRVMFINGPADSYLDEVVVGLPMLALETGPTAGIARTAGNSNGTTAAGNLTLEAWIRPRSLPTAAHSRAAIISQWNTDGADSQQSFRLYIDHDSGDHLTFEIGGTISGAADTESFDLKYTPTVNTWAHVAVTFDASSKDVRFYVNGELARSAKSSTDTSTGVRQAQRPFSVGASLNTALTAVDIFHGNVSDVRVWSAVRDADDIQTYFQRRLSATGSETNLVVNWVFDSESGIVGGSTDVQAAPASAADGTLTSASYVPALAVYFRPVSTDFCPALTIVGPYQCDFRATVASGRSGNVSIPNNLRGFFAKVWGGGGGAYLPGTAHNTSGGGGGFSEGYIDSVSGTNISAQLLSFYAGGFGTGSTDDNAGGGGGAGSGIYLNTTPVLVAGGGGGGSFSDANVGGSGNCSTATGSDRCGLGGNGGGATVAAQTIAAPDEGVTCGGPGGDNSPATDPPPAAGDCPDGGADPSGRTGGAGTGGGAGGTPAFIAGGAGYLATGNPNAIGAGGGGGGAVGGSAGAYNDGVGVAGYGGGGGSGTANADVDNVAAEAGSYQASTANFTDSTRTGTYSSASKTVSLISPSLANSPVWEAGCTIQGPQIGSGNSNVIASIVSNSSILLQNNPTGSATPHAETLTVTCTAGTGTPRGLAGGRTDPYYSPSYITDTGLQDPGTAGTTGSVNGKSGAIVILW